MSDFAKLPVKDGFQGCFDYTNYNDGDTWINQYLGGSELNFTMINAIKNEGYILFPQMSGYAYLISDIGDNFTVYAIIKGDKSTSASSSNTCWTITTFGANSSYRVYVGQDGGTNEYNFWSPTGSSTNVSASEWHIIAYSVNNTVQKFYVDGELIKSVGTSRNFSVDNLCINTGSYNGAIPGIVQHSANVYVKYIGYATNNQSDIQIKQNSDWLLEQYGLKIPEKNSRLAGTDAVAIAYAIARNQESAETLRQLKKAYQEGMLDGDGDTKPIFETEDDPIINTDPENENRGETGDGTVIDISKGVWLTYKDDEGNPSAYVRVYTDDYFWSRTLAGSYEYEKHRICVDIYSADSTVLYSGYNIFWINTGLTCEYMEHVNKSDNEKYLDGIWYCVTSIKIRNNCVVPIINHIRRDINGVAYIDEIYERAASYSFSYLAGVSIGTYSKCSNVSPF